MTRFVYFYRWTRSTVDGIIARSESVNPRARAKPSRGLISPVARGPFVSKLALVAAGYVAGRLLAERARSAFIHSLMPATGEHTDFVEDEQDGLGGDVQRAGYQVVDGRLDRVRRGGWVSGLHSQGDI